MTIGYENFSVTKSAAELFVGTSKNLFDPNGRWRPGGWLIVFGVMLGWAAMPFALMTCCHPSDVFWLQAKWHGLPPPHDITASQSASGLVQALVAVVVLLGIELGLTMLYFRRARLYDAGAIATPVLWPIAAVLTGIIGNAWWLVSTGQFDWFGCLVGFSSIVLAEVCEWIIEGLGREIMFPTPLSGQH
jgi:uncharacterized membrane protein YhaH (DUF805 family)